MGKYDGTVDEIPYGDAQALLDRESEELLDAAREQLQVNYEEKGDGWQWEGARYHFWKACDELFSANHAVKQGDLATMELRIGDAWNHIVMASYVAYSEGDDD